MRPRTRDIVPLLRKNSPSASMSIPRIRVQRNGAPPSPVISIPAFCLIQLIVSRVIMPPTSSVGWLSSVSTRRLAVPEAKSP